MKLITKEKSYQKKITRENTFFYFLKKLLIAKKLKLKVYFNIANDTLYIPIPVFFILQKYLAESSRFHYTIFIV